MAWRVPWRRQLGTPGAGDRRSLRHSGQADAVRRDVRQRPPGRRGSGQRREGGGMDSVTQPLALVIGGTGTIGTAVIDRLVKRGHAVVATYRNQERPVRDGETTWARFDAEEPATAAAVAEAVRADGRTLRTLIYTVGVGSTKRSVVETPLDEFEQLWQANALGFVAIWQAAAELARADGASVVVVSSEERRVGKEGRSRWSPDH